MHLAAAVFLPRVIDVLMHIALQRPIAAGRVGIEPAARLDGEVGGLLPRLHRKIFGRLDDDRTLPADPRDNRRSIFIIMAPTRFALLSATTCPAPQVLFASVFRLPLVAGGVIEFIGFDRARRLALHLMGQGRIAQPPAPSIAGPDMDTYLPRDATGRTGKAQQKGGENPVRQRPLALVQQGIGEVVEGALAAIAPVAFAPGS